MPDHDAPTFPSSSPFQGIDWNLKGVPQPPVPAHVERDVLFASAAHFVEEAPSPKAGDVPDLRGDLVIPEADLGARISRIAMEPEERLKAFNATTGHILADAYNSFPEMVTASPVTNGPQAGVDANFYRANLRWLEAEGFIRFNAPEIPAGQPAGDMTLYTLTGKGLGVLQSAPASLQAHQASLGSAMTEAVKKGAKDSLGDLAKEAIKQGVGFATRMALEHLPHHLR